MLKCYFLNESFAWSMVGCLGSLPVDAQQNPPDFEHLIRRNMSKGSAGEQKNIRIHFYQPGLQLNMSIWGVKLIWKKFPRSVRFCLKLAEITLYLYRSVRNCKLEIKWQKQNYKPAKQSGR